MRLERLTKFESKLIGESLRAAADGPFFRDEIFHTLFGLQREELRRIADEWPLPQAPPKDVWLAVCGTLNNLLGYPHGMHDLWQEWISADYATVDAMFSRLLDRCG